MSTMTWVDAAAVDDVPSDDVVGIEVQGRDIALYGTDDGIHATDNICTHGHARLCDGFLEGHEIECPLHQGRFDVRTRQGHVRAAHRRPAQLPGEDRGRAGVSGVRGLICSRLFRIGARLYLFCGKGWRQ
jgi:naphthalene 1,2-dioxygenase system ferredoxin subunit